MEKDESNYIRCMPWISWKPDEYLRNYHRQVLKDTQHVMRYLIKVITTNKQKIDKSAVLEFGCGPTLYGVLPIGHYFEEIYLADYLSSNLTLIDKWIKRYKDMFNWTSHTKFALQISQLENPSQEQINKRENEIRAKIKSLLTCNAYEPNPLGKLFREKFPVVMTFFCAESISTNKEDWGAFMRNIFSLVAPEGLFIFASLLESTYYRVGNKQFPTAYLSVEDFKKLVTKDLNIVPKSFSLEVVNMPEHKIFGYEKILLASMHKKASKLVVSPVKLNVLY